MMKLPGVGPKMVSPSYYSSGVTLQVMVSEYLLNAHIIFDLLRPTL